MPSLFNAVRRPAPTVRGIVAVAATSALVALALVPPASAQTFVSTGTISTQSPSMAVVFIDGVADTCTGQGSTQVRYKKIPFTAKAAGQYSFTLTSDEGFASFYVYQGSFDPLDGVTNCVAADNSPDVGGKTIVTIDVATPGKYILVPFDDRSATLPANFKMVIDTPDGVATGANTGSGKRYAKLGSTFTCTAPRTGSATWTNRANKVDKAVFKANKKVVRTVNHALPGTTLGLTDLPKSTTKLTGIFTLKNGDKKTVTRSFYSC